MDCIWVSCWSHEGKDSSNGHICEARLFQEKGQCPGTSLQACQLCGVQWCHVQIWKGGRQEAFPAYPNSVEQPAYSGAWLGAANLCPMLQSRPGSLWRKERKHVWSIWCVGSTWKTMEKSMLRPPNKAFAVFECHQSLPPSSPLSSVRREALVSEKARKETYYPTSSQMRPNEEFFRDKLSMLGVKRELIFVYFLILKFLRQSRSAVWVCRKG